MTSPVEAVIDQIGAKELAERLGVTTQYIYKSRRLGYFSPARADDIERIFGVPRETLVKPALRAFITGSDPSDLI